MGPTYKNNKNSSHNKTHYKKDIEKGGKLKTKNIK